MVITTELVNVHKINGQRPYFDVYIGRAVNGTEFKEDSIWSNKFKISSQLNTIKKVLDIYEMFIRQKIKKNPEIYDIETLRGKILGCWCINTAIFKPPLCCHGQVLMKILSEKEKKEE